MAQQKKPQPENRKGLKLPLLLLRRWPGGGKFSGGRGLNYFSRSFLRKTILSPVSETMIVFQRRETD
jgi:hypothetical protein